jgi:hypothetical protein
MLQYHEIFPLAILLNDTLSATDIQSVGILKEVATQYNSNYKGKHNQSYLRMFITYMRNFVYKMFWPESISSAQD